MRCICLTVHPSCKIKLSSRPLAPIFLHDARDRTYTTVPIAFPASHLFNLRFCEHNVTVRCVNCFGHHGVSLLGFFQVQLQGSKTVVLTDFLNVPKDAKCRGR
eukprot:2185833-Amphidinium_carterae.1